MKSMLKIKNFSNRLQTNGIYDLYISYKVIQAKYRPLTPNIIETVAFFTHPYAFTPHTQYLIYLNRSKITYEDGINAENQKLFKSLTDKWYISLIIYIMKHFKPNTEH